MSEKMRESINGEWSDQPDIKPSDGGPAFPFTGCGTDGMTLRDKFADSVLPDVFSEYAKTNMLPLAPDVKAAVALECYSMADAMLWARGREVKNES